MKAKHTTQEAIDACIRCLLGGMPSDIVKHYLAEDGFDPRKADIVIRWAKLCIQRNYYERPQT